MSKKQKIAIIGAGLTGLVAGYRLTQKGHKVTIFERSGDIGGLMGGFEIGGTSLEKAYHHIFDTDKYIISLAEELGLKEKLKWYRDNVGLYYGGKMYPFMGAMDLLQFKPLDFMAKVRLGLVKIWLQMDNNWRKYENITAAEWMKKYCGKRGYEVIWEPLLRGKFHKFYDKVSMAWLWARIHTRGDSRLGYMTGGFKIIADELAKKIKEKGGEIKLKAEAEPSGLLRSARNDGSGFDKVLFTGPSKKVDYLGAICVIFTSKQNLSPYYWHNINDTDSPFLAFIQHTNLVDKNNYGNRHVYYLGTYVPLDHENFSMTDKDLYKNFFDYLKKIKPDFDEKMIENKWNFRLKNAQHVVTKNYQVPKSKIGENIYQANFAMIYPEDRGINFAVKEGGKVAKLIYTN